MPSRSNVAYCWRKEHRLIIWVSNNQQDIPFLKSPTSSQEWVPGRWAWCIENFTEWCYPEHYQRSNNQYPCHFIPLKNFPSAMLIGPCDQIKRNNNFFNFLISGDFCQTPHGHWGNSFQHKRWDVFAIRWPISAVTEVYETNGGWPTNGNTGGEYHEWRPTHDAAASLSLLSSSFLKSSFSLSTARASHMIMPLIT